LITRKNPPLAGTAERRRLSRSQLSSALHKPFITELQARICFPVISSVSTGAATTAGSLLYTDLKKL